ncbi:hypothetical protein COV11_00570 [Candidatus Woesearchaeota archaeon CG10_big_fil_rev_8_21_14_0_10_30_7]|nr:MAG: hypothetical protein COV11_00570 [Candidatus Woesearchaeota archaeon CG10_big_fil_rev_8_21_14_0_10_30_7]
MVHIRKLVKAGQTSHTVSLPKEWLAKNNLGRGDAVYIHEKNSDELIINPSVTKEINSIKEITLDFHKKELETLKRELTSAYVNNYNVINIVGKQVSKHNQDIKGVLNSFVALEISEQTEQKLVIKDLLNLNEVDINKTIRRMDMIVRSMFKELNSTDALNFKDEDVNKIYFLIFRLLKSALENTKNAEKLNVKPLQVLSYWYLVVNIENLADCCTSLGSKVDNKTKKIVDLLEQQYSEVMNSFFSKDKNTADRIARERKIVLEELSKVPGAVSENLKQILTSINNIARIVLDEE